MISIGSRDGRKGLGLGLEMEDTELEEGEALGYNDVDGDSTVDPDIALSYIEEKLQNVLGHFQKDFEGGVSAENLGAKFGGYGSFLPTYQRSPSWSHTRSPQNVHSHATPRSSRKLHTEDQIQNSLASSTATPSARPPAASGKTSSMGNYSKGGICVPSNHTEEFTSKSGVATKSVDPSDQRTLKVRIKVGAENLSAQKNAEIYSGLGLVVSPSSSLDDSPSTSERVCGDRLDVPDQSPTSILQIMTSFPGGILLSPLSEDLLYLTERRKPRVKSESKPGDKTSLENSGTPVNGSRFSRSNQKVVEQKKMRSSEENGAFSTELTREKSNGDKDNTVSLLKKERETNLDSLGCEELVSNALKLPLLSSSEYSVADPVKGMSLATTIPMKALKDGLKEEIFSEGRFDSKFGQDIGSVEKSGGKVGSSGKVSDSKKENLVSKTAAYSQQDVLEAANPHSSDQSESNVPRGRNSRSAEPIDSSKQLVVQKGGSLTDEGFKAARGNSSTGGKKKQKGLKNQLIADSSVTAKIGKSSHANGLLSKTQKDSEKPVDRYKEFFGDVEFEDGDNESISGEMTSSRRLKDPQPLIKKSMNERPNKSKEKRNIRSSEKPRPPETYPGAGSHAAPPLGNEPNSEAPSLIIPPPNDDWVCCERCQKWRLLPLGMDPRSLPDEWICRMLTWLPGMNRCSVPEEVTTSSVKAIYHPVAAVPAPATEGQLDLVNNPVPTSAASVDARYSGQEQQNIAIKTPSISGKKKHGSKNPTNSIDLDGSTHSSNSKRKSLPTSIRNGNSNSGNRTPSLDAGGYQHVQKSSSDIERHNDNKKDKKVSLVSCSDKGTNLKIRRKRESDLDGPRPSKRSKGEELRDDENWTSDNGESFSKAGRGSTSGLPINASGNDRHKYANHHKNTREESRKNVTVGVNQETQVPGTSADGLPRSSKSDDKDSVRKRKWKEHSNSQIQTEPLSSSGRNHQDSGGFMEEMCENGPQKEKKARVSKSGLKDSSVGKDQKGRSADYLKSDMGSLQHSVAANSSSSKVSGSHKKKTSAQEVNGSPVESVSSSPLRFSVSNADKVTSIRSNLEKNDIHDSGSLTAVTPRRFSVGEDDGGNDQKGMVKKDPILTDNDCETDVYGDRLRQNNQYSSEKHTSERGQVEEKINPDQSRNSGSQSKKSGKGLSSHSKERDRASGSDLEKEKTKASDFSHDEKSKNRRTQLDEKSGTPRKADKFIVKKDTAEGTISESSKGQSKIKSGGHDAQDKRQHHQQEREDEKLPKKHNQAEANGNGKSHLLPPLARVQTEISGSQKQNGSKVLAADALDKGDSSKASYQSRKAENQNGQPIVLRHATPNSHKGRDVEAPSPLRRDSSSYTANSSLKEAKDLKHAADRLKNSGSTDSTGFYFQAALKFLQGASLLESGNGEGTKHNDIMHAVHIYSSTAKLCDFCAREYERSRDMAAAALAYKCMEVAYMRVVYSANTNASRDRVELQSALQIVPPGESPSSSASDVDNLNQQGTTDKASLAKVVESPQVSGSHIITSRNRTGVSRLLSFAENVNLAMEASRKSRNAFTAATSALGETSHREGIGSVKKALDFNFQDVEVLLRLVRVAMEDITR